RHITVRGYNEYSIVSHYRITSGGREHPISMTIGPLPDQLAIIHIQRIETIPPRSKYDFIICNGRQRRYIILHLIKSPNDISGTQVQTSENSIRRPNIDLTFIDIGRAQYGFVRLCFPNFFTRLTINSINKVVCRADYDYTISNRWGRIYFSLRLVRPYTFTGS